MVKNANWWSKSNLTISQTAQFFPFKKGFNIAHDVVKYKKL